MKGKRWFGVAGTLMVLAAAMALVVCAGGGRGQGGDNYAFTHDIGDTGPGGGIVFYRAAAAFGDGWRYLEVAPENISGTKAWASIEHTSTSIVGASGAAIGTGKANTDAILVADVNAPAAKACADYNSAGKDDWFLPSKDELKEMYRQKSRITGITTNYYWSSSEVRGDVAWGQGFLFGLRDGEYKSVEAKVRPVRAF
ncbi:MAG: DUF1566 domain-containing protein [Treponema sp.]|nr:DUF1566 domain-containing protein [Treponema sp.]